MKRFLSVVIGGAVALGLVPQFGVATPAVADTSPPPAVVRETGPTGLVVAIGDRSFNRRDYLDLTRVLNDGLGDRRYTRLGHNPVITGLASESRGYTLKKRGGRWLLGMTDRKWTSLIDSGEVSPAKGKRPKKNRVRFTVGFGHAQLPVNATLDMYLAWTDHGVVEMNEDPRGALRNDRFQFDSSAKASTIRKALKPRSVLANDDIGWIGGIRKGAPESASAHMRRRNAYAKVYRYVVGRSGIARPTRPSDFRGKPVFRWVRSPVVTPGVSTAVYEVCSQNIVIGDLGKQRCARAKVKVLLG